MSSAKPTTLKWAKGLAILQIVVGLLGGAFLIWLFGTSASSEIIEGMRQGVIESLGETSVNFSSPEGAGYIFGLIAAGLLAPIFTLVAIKRRSKNWTIASLIFLGLNLVTGFSVVTLAIFILMAVKPSREYLNLTA
jgi:hypothetical protein